MNSLAKLVLCLLLAWLSIALTGQAVLSGEPVRGEFSLRLLKEVDFVDKNVAISVGSVRAALALTQEGAAGLSRDEIVKSVGDLPGYSPGAQMSVARALGFNFREEGTYGMRVSGVRKGSPAEVAGFRNDDVVFAVNDAPIPNATAYRSALERQAATKEGWQMAGYASSAGKSFLRKVTIPPAVSCGIWVQSGIQVQPDFRKAAEEKYGAQIALVDFQSATAAARSTINTWLREKADIAEGELRDISTETKLYLAATSWFQGEWKLPFNEAMEGEFGKNKVKCYFMQLPSQIVLYHRSREHGYSAVELLFRDTPHSAVFVLPRKDSSVGNLLDLLGRGELETLLKEFKETQATVMIPQFEFAARIEMKPVLEAIGVRRIFGKEATLTGISSAASLRVTDIAHACYVRCDETGFAFRGATGVSVGVIGTEETFIADQPFLFFVRDRSQHRIELIGTVAKPSANRLSGR